MLASVCPDVDGGLRSERKGYSRGLAKSNEGAVKRKPKYECRSSKSNFEVHTQNHGEPFTNCLACVLLHHCSELRHSNFDVRSTSRLHSLLSLRFPSNIVRPFLAPNRDKGERLHDETIQSRILACGLLGIRFLLATCTTSGSAGHATTTSLSGFGRRERSGSKSDCFLGRQDRKAWLTGSSSPKARSG